MTETSENKPSKYTPDGLPVVSRGTVVSLVELAGARQEQMQDELEKRLDQENQELSRIMDEIMEAIKEDGFSEDYMAGIAYGVLLTYESLRRQSAANKLEHEIESE